MLVKRPKSNSLKWMKIILGVEFASVGVAYFAWHQMNHSRDFRLFMYKHANFVLRGFYITGESLDPGYNLREEDRQFWYENGFLPIKSKN